MAKKMPGEGAEGERPKGAASTDDGSGTLKVQTPLPEGKSREQMLTELTMLPSQRHALLAKGFGGMGSGDPADYLETGSYIAKMSGKVRAGNLDDLTDMLTAQAMTLDTMVSEYSRRAMLNLGQYPDAVERYMNIALKAQANCRVTVETLARVKRGGKQIVKVIHVHEGGQAVVADTINQGVRRGIGAENDEQAQGPIPDVVFASLPCPDPTRDGMPLPSYEGEEAVPDPRRAVDRRSEGKS